MQSVHNHEFLCLSVCSLEISCLHGLIFCIYLFQLKEGDKLDYIVEKNGNKLLVQRVKVEEISYRDTSKDHPTVSVKVWKKTFEIDFVSKH